MKTLCRLCVVLTFSLFIASPALAQSTSSTLLGVGLRHHATPSVFTDYPFEDGDMSYGISYELNDAAGYWQIAVEYAANTAASRTNSADYVVTPQLNLVIEDNFWRAGVGIAANYIEYETDAVAASEADANTEASLENGWSDVYYQFLLGVCLPLGSMSLDIFAAYPFDDWGALDDFDANDIEIALWLKFSI